MAANSSQSLSSRNLHLEDYKFVKVIGIGSSGIMCQYSKDGIFYAIKLVNAINLSGVISQEIKTLTRLNSYDFSIPRLYDYGSVSTDEILKIPDVETLIDLKNIQLSTPKKSYYGIVMEFIDGINLEEYVEEYGLDNDSIRNIAIWMFDLLRYLHQMNIVHRDIKPANIIFRPDQRLYLVDFGFACSTIEKEILCSSQVMSTPYFIGPEGWSGYIDNFYRYKGLDVWAAGVTLYYLVTGEPPWALTEVENRKLNRFEQRELLRNKILKEPLHRKHYYSADPMILDVIERALTKNPSERPTAEMLYQELKS